VLVPVWKDSRCVVSGLHKGVDQSVDLRLLACDREVLSRLEINLVPVLCGLITLIDALLARAVPHQASCRVNYL